MHDPQPAREGGSQRGQVFVSCERQTPGHAAVCRRPPDAVRAGVYPGGGLDRASGSFRASREVRGFRAKAKRLPGFKHPFGSMLSGAAPPNPSKLSHPMKIQRGGTRRVLREASPPEQPPRGLQRLSGVGFFSVPSYFTT